MVKKKATRAKGREKATLTSSARSNFIDQQDADGGEDNWKDQFDIIVAKKDQEVPTPSQEDIEYQQRLQNARLTKKQKKRIEILKERKRKKEQRQALYDSLDKHKLSDDQMQILQSSARLGQTNTEKQKLKLALKKNRLGIETPDVQLFKEVSLPEFVNLSLLVIILTFRYYSLVILNFLRYVYQMQVPLKPQLQQLKINQ